MTVLTKLHEKGLTKRAKVGRSYVYEALYDARELREKMAQQLVRKLVDDFGDAALVQFAAERSRRGIRPHAARRKE